MVKPTGPTNPYLKKLIIKIERVSKKNKSRFWAYVAELLKKPRRKRVEVNLWKISKYANDNDTIIVPGKVLGYGELTKKVIIAAWKFSKNAERKIINSGSKVISIEELLERNPKGSNVKIII